MPDHQQSFKTSPEQQLEIWNPEGTIGLMSLTSTDDHSICQYKQGLTRWIGLEGWDQTMFHITRDRKTGFDPT